MNWSEEKAAAFVQWRKGNQRAYTYPIEACLRSPVMLEEFEQWYAVQRLLGKPLPAVRQG